MDKNTVINNTITKLCIKVKCLSNCTYLSKFMKWQINWKQTLTMLIKLHSMGFKKAFMAHTMLKYISKKHRPYFSKQLLNLTAFLYARPCNRGDVTMYSRCDRATLDTALVEPDCPQRHWCSSYGHRYRHAVIQDRTSWWPSHNQLVSGQCKHYFIVLTLKRICV